MTDSEDQKCTICLENMPTTSRRVDLSCSHRFHEDCAAQLVESMSSITCPLCRATFDLKQLLDENNKMVDLAETRWPSLLRENKERRSAQNAHQEFVEGMLRNAFHHIQVLSFQRNMLQVLPVIFSSHDSSVFLPSPIFSPFSHHHSPTSTRLSDPDEDILLRILQAASSGSSRSATLTRTGPSPLRHSPSATSMEQPFKDDDEPLPELLLSPDDHPSLPASHLSLDTPLTSTPTMAQRRTGLATPTSSANTTRRSGKRRARDRNFEDQSAPLTAAKKEAPVRVVTRQQSPPVHTTTASSPVKRHR
eukprot:m.19912 g.19912  ORF g.19912 m.19912 type:complete len:306 (+) comp10974_c0_seq1:313-1230(+)